MKKEENNFIDDLKDIKDEDLRNLLMEIVIQKKVPEKYPKKLCTFNMHSGASYGDMIDDMLKFRHVYTNYCSWCMVSTGWIKELSKLLRGKNCIEVMAGKGLISYALQEVGVNITASDNYSWHNLIKYTKVDVKEAEYAVKEAIDLDYVICSWPPMEETDICQVIKVMAHKHPKAKLIYIGEGYDGCTGCYDMWDITDIIIDGKEAHIIDKANRAFYTFEGMHDSIYLMRPNDRAKRWRRKR